MLTQDYSKSFSANKNYIDFNRANLYSLTLNAPTYPNTSTNKETKDGQGKVIEASYDGHEIQQVSEDMQEEVQWYSLVVSANDVIEATIDHNYNEFLKVDAEA